MLIDAHHHLWQVSRPEFEWPTADLPIHRDFDADEFLKTTAGSGVTGSVLVQAQPNAEETSWLLDIADRTSWILGVVGWVDMEAPDASSRIAQLAHRPKLRGVRPMLQALSDDDWISRAEQRPALEALVANDLSLDALVNERHLPALIAVAQAYPGLRIIIDHCAKPRIAERQLASWSELIGAFAALPNVYCKLSGLLTEAEDGACDTAFTPYIRRAADVFSGRLMWGSDWPVLSLRSEYRHWLRLVSARVKEVNLDRDTLFTKAAVAAYRLRY